MKPASTLPSFIRRVGIPDRPRWHSRRYGIIPAASRSWARCRSIARRPALFERAVSIPGIAHLSAAGLRRLRSATHVLGDRYHKDALLLAAVRDDVHRGIALAQGPRPRTGHGRGAVRLVGLETHPLT